MHMKKFPSKLKARGMRELPLKLDAYRCATEFSLGSKKYFLDVMQAAVFLMQALHRSAWDYGTYTQADMFDRFERHYPQLQGLMSSEANNYTTGDVFLDALDYLVADRYLIKWKSTQTSEPEYILFSQHSILGTPDEVTARFGDYTQEKVQTEIMKVWLEAHTPVVHQPEALMGYRRPEPKPIYSEVSSETLNLL